MIKCLSKIISYISVIAITSTLTACVNTYGLSLDQWESLSAAQQAQIQQDALRASTLQTAPPVFGIPADKWVQLSKDEQRVIMTRHYNRRLTEQEEALLRANQLVVPEDHKLGLDNTPKFGKPSMTPQVAYRWASAKFDLLPEDAVVAGYKIGRVLYLCQVNYGVDTYPGVLDDNVCRFEAAVGHILEYHSYQLLAGHGLRWLPASDGGVPPGAIAVGQYRATSQPIYACQARYQGGVYPGYVIASGCRVVASQEKQAEFSDYRVLVQ